VWPVHVLCMCACVSVCVLQRWLIISIKYMGSGEASGIPEVMKKTMIVKMLQLIFFSCRTTMASCFRCRSGSGDGLR
jgi:hypothetical protein